VAVWMIEALKRDYDVTVLTWSPPDVDRLNRFYGTSLARSEFRVHSVPAPVRWVFKLDPDPRSIQKLCLLIRIGKIIGKRFDVLVTAAGEVDFGRRGIQYVSYPHLQRHYATWQSLRRLPRRGRLCALIRGRYRPWMLLAGYSFDRMKDNVTLVNSDWTRAKFRESYAADALTVYPPVPAGFPDVPWGQREDGFVCLGRISSEKRVEQVIDILARVRERGHGPHLHIIGNPGEPRSYYDKVCREVRQRGSWVTLHEGLSREAVSQLVAQHRYGIHGRPDEHFGIAVAEMMKAGCIVFAPADGGQVEIAGGEDRLLYRSADDAVEKILRVMNDTEEQTALRRHVDVRSQLFSPEAFTTRIQDVVREFLRAERSVV